MNRHNFAQKWIAEIYKVLFTYIYDAIIYTQLFVIVQFFNKKILCNTYKIIVNFFCQLFIFV